MEKDRKRELDWLWLCSISGLYETDRKKLLQSFGTPENIRRSAQSNPGALSFLGERKQRMLIRQAQIFSGEREYHKLQERGISFISCEGADYPQALLQLPDYPSGLFYMGSLPQRDERCVAVIGARRCTYNGRNQARTLAGRLARSGVSVVSGMAYGIDAKAQEACLEAGGKSYAVLGCGVDVCYPRENESLYRRLIREGGVLSEFCPGTQPLSIHFPIRNRIISGLSELVVVVEARRKSGTLITADLALEQGKDVYAFPGRVQDVLSDGCNRLIRQGAGMIVDIDEFLEENGMLAGRQKKEESRKMELTEQEHLVYRHLDSGAKDLQTLAEETGLPIPKLMSALGSLQVKGVSAETGKNHYENVK